MSPLGYIVNGFTIICFLAIYAYVTSLVGNSILGTSTGRFPFQRGMKTRASLIDIYVLVAQLGLAGAIISQDWLVWFHIQIYSRDVSYALLIVWPQLILCWFLGLRVLTRACIQHELKRVIFLSILAPSAFGGIYFVCVYCLHLPRDLWLWEYIIGITWFFTLLWLTFCGLLSRHLIRFDTNVSPPTVDSSHEQTG